MSFNSHLKKSVWSTRAIIYSIIDMEAFKKNDIFLFILLFREVGLNAIQCRRKDCMFYDVFSSKDLSPVKSLHALHDVSRLDHYQERWLLES